MMRRGILFIVLLVILAGLISYIVFLPSPAGLFARGYQNFKEGKYTQANELLNDAHRMRKNNVVIAMTLADSLFFSGRYAEAEKVYSSLQKLKPDSIDVLYRMGWVAFLQEDYDKANEYLLDCYNRNPRNPRIVFLVGTIAFNASDFDKAFFYLEKLEDMDSDLPLYNSMLSQIYFKKGVYGKAIEYGFKAVSSEDATVQDFISFLDVLTTLDDVNVVSMVRDIQQKYSGDFYVNFALVRFLIKNKPRFAGEAAEAVDDTIAKCIAAVYDKRQSIADVSPQHKEEFLTLVVPYCQEKGDYARAFDFYFQFLYQFGADVTYLDNFITCAASYIKQMEADAQKAETYEEKTKIYNRIDAVYTSVGVINQKYVSEIDRMQDAEARDKLLKQIDALGEAQRAFEGKQAVAKQEAEYLTFHNQVEKPVSAYDVSVTLDKNAFIGDVIQWQGYPAVMLDDGAVIVEDADHDDVYWGFDATPLLPKDVKTTEELLVIGNVTGFDSFQDEDEQKEYIKLTPLYIRKITDIHFAIE